MFTGWRLLFRLSLLACEAASLDSNQSERGSFDARWSSCRFFWTARIWFCCSSFNVTFVRFSQFNLNWFDFTEGKRHWKSKAFYELRFFKAMPGILERCEDVSEKFFSSSPACLLFLGFFFTLLAFLYFYFKKGVISTRDLSHFSRSGGGTLGKCVVPRRRITDESHRNSVKLGNIPCNFMPTFPYWVALLLVIQDDAFEIPLLVKTWTLGMP